MSLLDNSNKKLPEGLPLLLQLLAFLTLSVHIIQRWVLARHLRQWVWWDHTIPRWRQGCGTVLWLFCLPYDIRKDLQAATYPWVLLLPISDKAKYISHHCSVSSGCNICIPMSLKCLLYNYIFAHHFCNLSATAGGLLTTISVAQNIHLTVVWIVCLLWHDPWQWF